MTFFVIGLLAVVATVVLLFTERRGMYFRLFTLYYFTPRIGERMHIVKTGYDEKGQIAILEGVGLDKTYALPCIHLPQKSAAGTEDVFVYRQKFPTTQNIYRYSAMETELLAVGREVDNSVTVVKGAKRIASDSEWRSVHLLVYTLKLLLCGCLALCVVILFVFLLTGSIAAAVMMAVLGLLALTFKLLFKAERHGPALRVYSDVASTPPRKDEEAFVRAANRIGLDDNERRAFLREKERREIFEKMNPRFNEFYDALKNSVGNPPVPPEQNQVLTSAAKSEMNRVCFAVTAHPQTKAEAVAAKQRVAASKAPREIPDTENGPAGGVSGARLGDENGAAPDAAITAQEGSLEPAGSSCTGRPETASEGARASCVETSGAEVAIFEELGEDRIKHPRDKDAAREVETIVLEDCDGEPGGTDRQPPLAAEEVPDVEPGTDPGGSQDSSAPPSKEDFSDVMKGNKVICTTCGCICRAPNSSNWAKTRCTECGATIRRNRL